MPSPNDRAKPLLEQQLEEYARRLQAVPTATPPFTATTTSDTAREDTSQDSGKNWLQRPRNAELAAAVARVANLLIVNAAATIALRRLTAALADAGVPVPALDGRAARRIAWPAMALLRMAGAALHPEPEGRRR